MTTPASPTEHAAEVQVRRLPELYDAERAFAHVYGDSEWAFWMDSAMSGAQGRFSFVGDSAGPEASVVIYDSRSRRVRVESDGGIDVFEESIFDYLTRELGRRRQARGELPFDFNCGFAGYFGYELKAECDGEDAHRSPTPDAAFIFADRLVAFDHLQGCTWLVALSPPAGHAVANQWFDETERLLTCLPDLPGSQLADREPVDFNLRRSRERYLDDITACHSRLVAGESYEVCLTNKVVAPAPADPLSVYRALRRINPAPFGAYLRLGDTTVLSSSPERFLRIAPDRSVEARPIKGTSPRGSSPTEDAALAAGLAADEKTRAENVTIVDLMRNDLGIVCEPGSVHVPDLMRVETYETVHQLVSTVRGRLREDVAPAECIRACFPPGSMTGAPKRRTMEILDELEGEARGVYSGAIGYLGLGGGCDLSVAIRTIVTDGEEATIGCGGAIVLDSDPGREFEEMLLKARAPMRATDFGTLDEPSDGRSAGFGSLAPYLVDREERATRLPWPAPR